MLLAFPLDIGIMIREHRNRWYSVGAYFMAKTIADLPFQIFFDLLFVTIAYLMSDQIHDVRRFFLFNTIVTMNSLVTQSMALLIGAAAPSVEAATFIGPISCIPVLIFAGFFIKKDALAKGFQWLVKTSFAHYTFEGCIISLYGNISDNVSRGPLECTTDPETKNVTLLANDNQNVTIQCERKYYVTAM